MSVRALGTQTMKGKAVKPGALDLGISYREHRKWGSLQLKLGNMGGGVVERCSWVPLGGQR